MVSFSFDAPLSLRLPKTAASRLKEAGINTVSDLVYYAPRRYYQWGKLSDIASLEEGEEATVLVEVLEQNLVRNRTGNGYRLIVSVTDGQSQLNCTFFAKNPHMLARHQRLLQPGVTVLVAGKVSEYGGRRQLVQPQFEEVEEGSQQDISRRAGRPIPIYRSLGGLPSWKIASLIQSLLDQIDDSDLPDILDEDIRSRHALFTHAKAVRLLHSPETGVDWQTAIRTLAWQEAFVLQTALYLSRLGDERQSVALRSSSESGLNLVDMLVGGLPFELTDGQKEAWEQISKELDSSKPMQRLLQADVGAGKTVIALMAMTRTVESGYQAALLAPTEVLARQHYASLANMLDRAGIDVPIHLLTSKRAAFERGNILALLASGEPCIVVGTHALIQDSVDIARLGLLVVDEQHRFGVAQRERLRQDRENVPHLLVMTATPIPRTVAMTVFGDLDLTAMRGLPPGRQTVSTFLVDERNQVWVDRIWQRAREEIDGGGRVYVVCPQIDPSDKPGELPLGRFGALANEKSVVGGNQDVQVPSATTVFEDLKGNPHLEGIAIGLAHGRLKAAENAATFAKFADGTVPLLVATTVVEVGVDVPEATMMVILGSTRFGLAQLHQLRGRVGRSERASVCMMTHQGDLAPETAERLKVIANTTDGFELAEADLRLRREGDVLGKSQSGSVSSLRFLSVRNDAAIIAVARETAAALVQSDPKLLDHPALADAVRARAGEELVWLERT